MGPSDHPGETIHHHGWNGHLACPVDGFLSDDHIRPYMELHHLHRNGMASANVHVCYDPDISLHRRQTLKMSGVSLDLVHKASCGVL